MSKNIICFHLIDKHVKTMEKFKSMPKECCFEHSKPEKTDVPLWICLDCGQVGCSRYSENQCMLNHVKDTGHRIAVNPDENLLWCYECDDELHEMLLTNEDLGNNKLYKQTDKRVNLINNINYKLKTKAMNQITNSIFSGQKNTMAIGIGKKTNGVANSLSRKDDNIFGLRNLGNTCFFNSVAQVMLNTDLFIQYLTYHKNKFGFGSVSLEFINLAQKTTNDVKNPKSLFSKLIGINKMYGYYNQQDSHECFNNFIELLEKDLKKSKIQNELPFIGYLTYNSKCLNCNFSEYIFEESYTIMLDISKNKEYGSIKSELEKRLIESVNTGNYLNKVPNDQIVENKNLNLANFNKDSDELYENALWVKRKNSTSNFEKRIYDFFSHNVHSHKHEGYRCEKCKDNSEYGFTRYSIVRPPPILIVCLKRFSQVSMFNFHKKDKKIHFPANFNLNEYCVSINGERQTANYELYGAVQHSGSLRGGHYTCYVKKESGQWYYISDSYYNAVDENKALNSSAYLLFYRRV